ncbi:MAG TPA: 1-deoxy-D-xylulose-5-phosphate reductoisomerase [Roseiarcus sp.]|nr:1-deoxy-D-xylulose-5-phosphate reductoisomerase [Roseiarcus sp.]
MRPIRQPLDARAATTPKRLVILGATGSIGRSCAEVVLASRDRFEVVALAGGKDGAALAEMAIALGAKFVAIADPAGYGALKSGLAGRRIETAAGDDAVREAALRDADLVVAAIVGAVGLAPTYAAVAAGRTIALANKETLVCAGAAVMAASRAAGARLLPLDSEHNAIFQAMGGCDSALIDRMTLTASGGPFRDWSLERIATATKAEALAHPNWAMGPKVTIDSASLMNKGLELIEAHHLFGVSPERLDVLVHPQSVVHGFVSFADGSVIAGMAAPDMKTPIAHCLAYPDRIVSGAKGLDLAAIAQLSFSRPDLARFPALGLAMAALREGGGAPTALNAANEIAVEAFLADRIGFAAIPRLVERVLEESIRAAETPAPVSVEEALAIHYNVRDRTRALLA